MKFVILFLILLNFIVSTEPLCVAHTEHKQVLCFHPKQNEQAIVQAVQNALSTHKALYRPSPKEIENMRYHVARVKTTNEVTNAIQQVLMQTEVETQHHWGNTEMDPNPLGVTIHQNELDENAEELSADEGADVLKLIDSLPGIHAAVGGEEIDF